MKRRSSDEIRLEALRKLARKNQGILLPRQVVDAARNPKSPLHKEFEWDDSVAAEEYRLFQARQLISITVRYIKIKGGKKMVRMFVSLTPDRSAGGGYRETREVLSNKEWRAQLLYDAMEELRRFELKYSELEELAQVFAASKAFREQME